MAHAEQPQDTKRMDESRSIALGAINAAAEALDRQGPAFERHARIAELAVALYDADARRMGISRG